MIIQFGMGLDGMQPSRPATTLGEITLGPARLLDLLELRLGLPHAAAPPGRALLAYQASLAELNHCGRFYHRSFATDPFGVARTLLRWRERWYEAGWRGEFDGPVSPRLADMAAIETLARQRVPPTRGQRLERVTATLAAGLDAGVSRIVLHDDPGSLPLAWRRVLERLTCELADGVRPAPQARPGSDLHHLQHTLLNLATGGPAGAGAPRALAGDGSVVVLRGISRDLSAQVIAEHLRNTAALDDSVVIAEQDGIILDNALERVGLPRAGFRHHSRFRAITQVLKLGLALVWAPPSPRLLLQFLLHPVGPLPRFARSRLAEAVAGEPGVGGPAWRGVLEDMDERLLSDIRYWLEPQRHPPDTGAPAEVLIERTRRCAAWLAGRLQGAADAERDLYAAAHAQAEALAEALAGLAAQGHERIPRIPLEQLVDEVSSRSADPATFAEARHVPAATDPAVITRAWGTVVWWDLAAPRGRVDDPWSDAELADLGQQGVALPSPEARIRAQGRMWLQPILNARERLILVVHDRDEGHHPLWSQLTGAVSGFREINVENALLDDPASVSIPPLDVETEPLPLRPLQAPKRWWTLPSDCRPAPREAESYSSLQKLIHYPHQWVLTYPARLATGRAANLPGLPLICGNLAHRLFESYFATFPESASPSWRDHDEAAVRRWLATALPRIIAQQGAILDEPGMGVRREAVIVSIEEALIRLLRHLDQAGVVRVVPEAWHEVPFDGIGPLNAATGELRLRGSIDLLLTDAGGREIVLDVKWGGEERRMQELAEQRALQLATYAYLRRRSVGGGADARWPEEAYFIVTTGNIVAHGTQVFPEALTPADLEASRPTAHDWARICAAFDWRWRQLASGAVECNAPGTEPDERSAPPDAAMRPLADPDRFDDFTWLTGWEPGE